MTDKPTHSRTSPPHQGPTMTDFTREWIAKREELIAWFSKPFRGMPQDGIGLSILATNDFPRALAALKAVLELHRPVEVEPSDTICGECSFQLPNGRYFGKVVEWPCPTVATIEAALWGES